MRLIVIYRTQCRPTWIALLAALEDGGLSGRFDIRLTDWTQAPAELEAAQAEGRRALIALTLKIYDAMEARAGLATLAPMLRLGDLVVAGGPHATALPAQTLALGVGAVLAGEGETAFVELVRRLTEGREWRQTPNLVFMNGGRLIRNEPAPLIDLDRSRSVFEPLRLQGPMELTRGCAWQCRYCQTPRLWQGAERHRSIAAAVALAARHHHFIQFLSPNALGYQSLRPREPNVRALVTLLETIRSRHPALRLNLGNFPSEVRPDYVTREALTALRPLIHNRVLAMGAQSGSPRTLRAIGRGHGVKAVWRAVEIAQETGFVPLVDVLFGLPGETPEEEALTRGLVHELARRNARVRAHVFLPLPDSAFADSTPSPLSPETRELLEALGRVGAVDGAWRDQMRKPGGADPTDAAAPA